MTKLIRVFSCSAALAGALSVSGPVFATGNPVNDSAQANKPSQKAGHDHEHEGHGDHGNHGDHKGHEGHGKKASGTGKTTIGEISAALHENLTCLDRELAAAKHDAFHACLETIEALGLDLIALKGPSDPAKKKRVNGYAKNLGMMAHKVDENMDGKQPEKAKS